MLLMLASSNDISTIRLTPTSVTNAVLVTGLIATQHVADWPATTPFPLTVKAAALVFPPVVSTAAPKDASVTKRSSEPGIGSEPKRTAVPAGDDRIPCWLTEARAVQSDF